MKISEIDEYLEEGETIEVIIGSRDRLMVHGKEYVNNNPADDLTRLTTINNRLHIYVEHPDS